jgi:hypothetical protein
LISDGDDNASHITLTKAEDAAEEEGVAVFSLAEYSSEVTGAQILRQASHATGGTAVISDKLNLGVAPVINAVNGQLVLDFVPAQPADQKSHSVTIKEVQKNVTIYTPARVFLP